MYSKDISKAHGRHAYGINPGSYTAWGFAETLKVPAEALPQEKTPQRSTRTRHCTQDSGGQKVCVWSRWGTGRGCGTFEGMLWDPKEGEARAWSLLGSWQHHLIQPQPHHCTPFYPWDVPTGKICLSSGCTQVRMLQSQMLKYVLWSGGSITGILTINSCLCVWGVSSSHIVFWAQQQ